MVMMMTFTVNILGVKKEYKSEIDAMDDLSPVDIEGGQQRINRYIECNPHASVTEIAEKFGLDEVFYDNLVAYKAYGHVFIGPMHV